MDGAVPHLGAEVPKWYGDTIGFWDGDALITWTSNVQGWKVHGNPEFSGKLQTIEIYTPNRDKDGKFIGLNHEGIFYDPDALVEPIRMMRTLERTSGFETGEPYTFIECVQTIFPVDGRAKPVVAGTVIPFKVPDMTAGRGRRSGRIPREGHEAAEGEGHQSFLRIAIGSMRAARRVGTDTAISDAVAMTSALAT